MGKIFQQGWWLLWVVYGAVLFTIFYLARRMRKKGSEPFHVRAKVEKYRKIIEKITNILCVSGVILSVITATYIIYPLLREYRNPIVPRNQENQKLLIGVICMLLASYLGLIAFFAGMTTFFQHNLTKIKRFVLLVISILPLSFLTAWFLIDDSTVSYAKYNFALGYFFLIVIVNGPGIVSGTSLFECSTKIYNKFNHKMQQS